VGHEHRATPEFWQAALRDAELREVGFQQVVAEAGMVYGVRPEFDGASTKDRSA
jgi:hypothetical protein